MITVRSVAVFSTDNMKAAKKEANWLRNYDHVKIVSVYMPDHPISDQFGNVLVIRVGEDKYLRVDGHVR